MVRGRITTPCQSRSEPGGAEAQRRRVSMPCMALGTALEFFPRVRFINSSCRPHQGTGSLPLRLCSGQASLRSARASIAVTR
jgi:hypothetical protein